MIIDASKLCPDPKKPCLPPNPPPPMQVECPGPKVLPKAPTTGHVEKGANGVCTWFPEPMKCPEGAMCNPPKPYEVACP